ncbi:hypothetical protein [Metabacillus sp. SLBN-84]
MKAVYEIQGIKQVIQEVEGGVAYIVRSPKEAAEIAAKLEPCYC